MLKIAGVIYKGMLDLIFPTYCLICRKITYNEMYLCDDCFGSIELNKEPSCVKCGKQLATYAANMVCYTCRRHRFLWGRAVACGRYTGVLKELIHKLKYENEKALAVPLALILLRKVFDEKLDKVDYVVPIPLSKKRKKHRGYNQIELVLEKVSASVPSIRTDLIVRKRETPAQVGLSRALRFKNMKDSFQVVKHDLISEKTILLVDDVLTTGATLNECARALKKSLAKNINVVVLAR
jgi:ComF family protein